MLLFSSARTMSVLSHVRWTNSTLADVFFLLIFRRPREHTSTDEPTFDHFVMSLAPNAIRAMSVLASHRGRFRNSLPLFRLNSDCDKLWVHHGLITSSKQCQTGLDDGTYGFDPTRLHIRQNRRRKASKKDFCKKAHHQWLPSKHDCDRCLLGGRKSYCRSPGQIGVRAEPVRFSGLLHAGLAIFIRGCR